MNQNIFKLIYIRTCPKEKFTQVQFSFYERKNLLSDITFTPSPHVFQKPLTTPIIINFASILTQEECKNVIKSNWIEHEGSFDFIFIEVNVRYVASKRRRRRVLRVYYWSMREVSMGWSVPVEAAVTSFAFLHENQRHLHMPITRILQPREIRFPVLARRRDGPRTKRGFDLSYKKKWECVRS